MCYAPQLVVLSYMCGELIELKNLLNDTGSTDCSMITSYGALIHHMGPGPIGMIPVLGTSIE